MKDIKLIAFDMDGTLTQHKTPLDEKNRGLLTELSKKYRLLMVGAGVCTRIFNQLNKFPIDIIGNYGMQSAKYNFDTKSIDIITDEKIEIADKESIESRIMMLREKFGFTSFTGSSVEYHPSGCITFPILGTAADISDKLAFDPDRAKRRVIYDEVCKVFNDYNVFIGGSSSFDMAPKPYNKYYALDLLCKEMNISHSQVAYAGDDYGTGGNDESIYKSDFNFICVDDYTKVSESVYEFLDK